MAAMTAMSACGVAGKIVGYAPLIGMCHIVLLEIFFVFGW